MRPRVWVFLWMIKTLCKLMKKKGKQVVRMDSHHLAMSKGSRLCRLLTESSRWKLLKVGSLHYCFGYSKHFVPPTHHSKLSCNYLKFLSLPLWSKYSLHWPFLLSPVIYFNFKVSKPKCTHIRKVVLILICFYCNLVLVFQFVFCERLETEIVVLFHYICQRIVYMTVENLYRV